VKEKLCRTLTIIIIIGRELDTICVPQIKKNLTTIWRIYHLFCSVLLSLFLIMSYTNVCYHCYSAGDSKSSDNCQQYLTHWVRVVHTPLRDKIRYSNTLGGKSPSKRRQYLPAALRPFWVYERRASDKVESRLGYAAMENRYAACQHCVEKHKHLFECTPQTKAEWREDLIAVQMLTLMCLPVFAFGSVVAINFCLSKWR
jgi:hypothetical protein